MIARAALSSESHVNGRGDIRARIDAALEKFAWQRMTVRAILLDQADLDALDAAMTQEFGGEGFKVHACGYRGHIVRVAKKSAIYSTHGVAVVVPKRLSAKVATRVAA